MKFKIEDKVRFRDERGEGVVTALIPPDRVKILMEGIEIPVYCKELIKVVFDHETPEPADS